MPEGAKLCAHCIKSKPLDAYYRHAKAPDGRRYVCKVCSRLYMLLHRRSPEWQAHQHEYNRTADVRERKRASRETEGYRQSKERYLKKPLTRLLRGRQKARYKLRHATSDRSRARIAATVAAYDREIARVRAKGVG